jgi:hypothetical protein
MCGLMLSAVYMRFCWWVCAQSVLGLVQGVVRPLSIVNTLEPYPGWCVLDQEISVRAQPKYLLHRRLIVYMCGV